MKFVTFGTKVLDDVLVGTEHENALSITGISPFVLRSTDFFQSANIDLFDDVCSSSHIFKMLSFQLSNELKKKLKCLKYDYFCIDFLNAWQPIIEFSFEDNAKMRITRNQCIKKYEDSIILKLEKIHGKLIEKKIIDPLRWTDNQLEREIFEYSNWLNSISGCTSEKILILETFLPYQKIEKQNIVFFDDIKEFGLKNTFIEKCINFIRKQNNRFIIIPKVDIFLGNEKSSNEDPSKYIQEYSTYIMGYIQDNFNEEKSDYLRLTYMYKMQIRVDSIIFHNIIKQYEQKGCNRSVILFGSETVLEQHPDFIKHVHAVIPYYYQNPWDENIIDTIRNKSESYVVILTHLFPNDEILKTLYKLGYSYPQDIITPRHDNINLSQFIGKYSDVYHNHVIAKREVTLNLQGNASVINVGTGQLKPFRIIATIFEQSTFIMEDNVRADQLSIGLNPGAKLFIGNKSTFPEGCKIRNPMFCNVIIGEDCMFASKVYIQAGDAHSIYEIETGECINYTVKMIDTEKMTIRLGGHVWVGYEAVLLPGTDIGSGSIVGARSVVRGRHPNNSIIVGVPARTVKKSIAWTRSPFITDIFSKQAYVDNKFIKKTEEGEA